MKSPRTVHVVSISGGKDSTATALLALELCDRLRLAFAFADTGNEHDAVYEYLDYLQRKLGITIIRLKADLADRFAQRREYILTKWPEQGVPMADCERAAAALIPTGIPFLDLCLLKGRFPSRRAQFCTQFLKTEPLVEYQLSLIDQGWHVWSWQGIRAEESRVRARHPIFEDVGGGLWNYRPIKHWSIAHVLHMHRKHGVHLNPLYRQGMSRVGCTPCINATKDEILEISKRWPEHIDRIEQWEAAVKAASKRLGASFFAAPDDGRGDIVGRNVREVVEWSKTQRGGRKLDLFRVTDVPAACSSSLGLCE